MTIFQAGIIWCKVKRGYSNRNL